MQETFRYMQESGFIVFVTSFDANTYVHTYAHAHTSRQCGACSGSRQLLCMLLYGTVMISLPPTENILATLQ